MWRTGFSSFPSGFDYLLYIYICIYILKKKDSKNLIMKEEYAEVT